MIFLAFTHDNGCVFQTSSLQNMNLQIAPTDDFMDIFTNIGMSDCYE